MTRIMSILSMLCGLLSCNAQNNGYSSLTVAEYEKAITAANVIKVDVRTAEEYAEGHIVGAINIDVQKADFEEKAKATLPKSMRASLSDKNLSPTLIAVNCRSGRRSKNAAAILAPAACARRTDHQAPGTLPLPLWAD